MIDLDDASSRVLPAGVRLSPISSATRQRATAYATTQQRPVAPVITRRAVHMSDEAKQLNADLSHALHDRPQVHDTMDAAATQPEDLIISEAPSHRRHDDQQAPASSELAPTASSSRQAAQELMMGPEATLGQLMSREDRRVQEQQAQLMEQKAANYLQQHRGWPGTHTGYAISSPSNRMKSAANKNLNPRNKFRGHHNQKPLGE